MKRILTLLLLTVSLISCSNDDNDNNLVIPTTPAASAGFTWRENDPNGADHTAPTAYFTSQYNTMIAKDAQGNTVFEINLTGGAAATYTLGSGTGNAVTFTAVNPYFAAESGEVIITSNAGGKMSGTFKAFRAGSGTTRLYGVFNDIAVNP